MAFADLMKNGLKETPEEEQIRLQQEEAQKVSLFEGWDKTAADDLLFSPPVEAEAPADYARNTLQAYYSKELGVDSLPEMAFNQFIKEDFGEGADYETALASLQETKRWGTEARDPTKLELAKHEKLTAGDWMRSFSANTTKALHGVNTGLFRAAAGIAAGMGQEDSKFYDAMMGVADASLKLGEERASIMTGDTFFDDITSDEANNDILAQNLGQLLMIVPLGVTAGVFGVVSTVGKLALSGMATTNLGMYYNEAFEQARDSKQTDVESHKTAGLYTLAAAPTETLVDLVTSGLFKPFTKYASKLSGEVRQRIVRTAIQGLTAAGPGGLVEGGQYALLNKLTNRKIDQGEFWATVRAGAILEGLGGSITQVAGEVDSARAKAKLRKDFKPVFGKDTEAVVDRVMGDGDPNNALNREVLNLVTADFKAISLLGEKSELQTRTKAATDSVINEAWKQAESEERARLNEEIQKQAELEAHETPEDIVIPEPAPATAGTPTDPAKADREKAKARKEAEKAREQRKKRKASLLEAMTVDTEQQRSYLKDDGTEVYEDGTPVEGSKVAPQATISEDTTPPPINRIDPNNGSNLARLTLAVMDNEKLSQEQALQRVATLPSATRKRYLEILDDGTMETVDLSPEEERIQAIDDELEAMGRAPQPPQTRTAFPEGLTSARIKALQNSMTREQAEQMYADGDQKNDFLAAVFDGDRKAVQRFNSRTQGRETQMELTLEPGTSYEAATQAARAPQPVVGDVVTLPEAVVQEDPALREITELTEMVAQSNDATEKRITNSGIDLDSEPLKKTEVKAGETLYDNKGRVWTVGKNKKMIPSFSQEGIQGVQGEIVQGKEYPFTDSVKTEWGWSADITSWRRGKNITTPTSSKILSVSEDGTLATVEGSEKPVLLSSTTRGTKGVSETVSGKVAEKLAPNEQAEVSAGAKVFRTLATQDYTDNPDLTVAENLAARNDFFFSKLPELSSALGVTEDELLVDGRQAELVDKLAEMTAPQGIEPPPLSEGLYKAKNEEGRAYRIAQGFIWNGTDWVHPDYPGKTYASSDVPAPSKEAVQRELAKIRSTPSINPVSASTAAVAEGVPGEQTLFQLKSVTQSLREKYADVIAKSKADLQSSIDNELRIERKRLAELKGESLKSSRVRKDIADTEALIAELEEGTSETFTSEIMPHDLEYVLDLADEGLTSDVENYGTSLLSAIKEGSVKGIKASDVQQLLDLANPQTLYQAPSKKLAKMLQDQGLTAEEAKQLASTKTEKQTIADIQTAFNVPTDEAAGVVAVIQSLGLDVNNFVFQEDKATAGKKYIAKTQFIPQLAKALVTAGKQANTETAVHEVAHVARRFLLTKGFEGAVETETIDTVETEYGVKDGKWTRAQEEQFAEHFVDFIKTGESPSQATDTLFQKMSNWIRKVTRLFTKQNQGVSEDMQKIFSALMQRGQISQTIDEQISQLEEEVQQAREGRNKKQTDHTPRDENDVPFTADEPVVQFRKRDVERIIGESFRSAPQTFFETVEIARQKGLIDNALATAKNVLADPERPITNEESAGMSVMLASMDNRLAVLDVKIAEAHRQAEENASRGGEQRGGFSSYLGKLQLQYQKIKGEQYIIAKARDFSSTAAGKGLGILKMGLNTETLEPDTVVRNINNQREKPMSSVQEAEIRSDLKGVKTLRDAVRSATFSYSRAQAETDFLYMMKQGGKKLQYGEASDLAVRIRQGLNSEGMTTETAMAMNNLANGYIAEGANTLDGVVDTLLNQFADQGLTEQDAWYAIAGRFVAPKEAVSELKTTAKLLKQESKLASQVEDALEGVFEKAKAKPVLTEAQKLIMDNPSIDEMSIKGLQNKLKLLQTHYEQNVVNSEKRKRTLAAIDEAQKQLDTMSRPVRYTQQTLDEESQALQDTLKDLRGQISDTDTKAKIDEALKTWSTPFVAKGTSFTSEARAKTKADLKEARDMMRMHMEQGTRDEAKLAARLLDRLQSVEASYDQMYSRLPSKKVMEPSEAIKDLQSRLSEAISAKGLQSRILNVQDLITNFSEEKYRAQLKELELNPVLVKESDRIMNLRTELSALNKHLNAKMERAKTGTLKFWAREILSINKAVLLSGDMPVLRQGGIVTSNPFRANFFDVTAKSAKVYWSGLTKGDMTEQVISDITKSKHFTESIRHGMQYPDSNATLTDGEMMVGANVAEKIPIFGRLISGSNQAQAAGIMLARYQAYESYRIKFPNASDAEMRAWADVVMTSTGKSTSEMVNRASTFMDVFIISTKYMASRFETMFKPLQYARTQPRVAREALKDLLWFFGTRVALVGLLKSFMGDKVDMGKDPLKSTFMKIMVDDGEGSTRVYDPFAGIAQPIRLVLGSYFIKPINSMLGGKEKVSPIDDTLRFLRARATPFLAMADGLASGKNYFGQKTGRGEIALRSYAPLPMQDLYDSIQASQDPFDMSVSSFFNVMGVNSYFDKTRRVRK